MEGLIEGRIVHFVLPAGPHAGEHRPAIVVKIWDKWNEKSGVVNLQVFYDGTNDHPHAQSDGPHIYWETSVGYSSEPEARTWHWIERA